MAHIIDERGGSSRPVVALGVTVALLVLVGAAPAAAQTAVSAARPDAFELTGGGDPVDVSLRGRGLDRVRSVEVTHRGRAVSDVFVRVVRRSATDLVVRLQATDALRDAQGYRLTLVTEKERVDGGVAVTAVAAPPPPTPRLSALELDATSLGTGESTDLTVVLDHPAPDEGATVALSVEGGPGLSVPPTLVVPGGQTTASGPVVAASVADDRVVTVRAAFEADERTAPVTVQADPALAEPPVEAADPVGVDVGTFVVTLLDPTTTLEPAEPVALDVGAFLVTLADPAAEVEPAEPVSVSVGTFVVTLAPPGGDS